MHKKAKTFVLEIVQCEHFVKKQKPSGAHEILPETSALDGRNKWRKAESCQSALGTL